MNLKEKEDELVKKHQAHLIYLKSLVRSGDWKRVMMKTGLTQTNVSHAFKRVGSLHHFKVVGALEEVIKERIAQYERVNG